MDFQAYIEALRPRHWVKSGFCLAALFFSGQFFSGAAWGAVLPLLVLFSLVSSAGYVVNDVWNVGEDQNHPRKRRRAIASGRLSVRGALFLVGTLYGVSLVVGLIFYGMGPVFWCVVGYVLLNLSYTFFLRRLPILDVAAISLGFVLRVCAGAFALGVEPSEWLMGLTYLLALLLGLGKRKGELRFIDKAEVEVGVTRGALRWYEGDFSSFSILAVAVVLFGSYCVYCVVVQGGAPFIFTAIPVGVALSSYVRAAGRSDEVEVPERMLLQWSVILGAFLIWGVLVVGLLYVEL